MAQRSAAAAKEIKQLIHTSVERAEQGSALVGQAGATMTEQPNEIKGASAGGQMRAPDETGRQADLSLAGAAARRAER